jgi:2-polyprenyl-6-methoxyphenol hydroxylase-like FAD-dependent oxidoreductase
VDDPDTHALITPLMERWRNMTLSIDGEAVVLDGIGFAAVGRLQLLRILQERALALGVDLRFDQAIESLDGLKADLVVGADGLNSLVRASDETAFDPQLGYFDNRFAWFGTERPFDTLTQTFMRSGPGALNAHHYRYAPRMSTFIVECDAASFAAHGFDDMDEHQSAAVCQALFASTLAGAPLLTNHSHWRRFPRLWCRRWVAGNRVILGDAAHTAHFSIGSGTRLAMEDAIALARALREVERFDDALQVYQQKRQPVARKIFDAANRSADWYDGFAERLELPAMEFAYHYLSRSGRLDRERLFMLAPAFMKRYETWQAQRRGAE